MPLGLTAIQCLGLIYCEIIPCLDNMIGQEQENRIQQIGHTKHILFFKF